MSNSREWSQRHIEELIKRNGVSGSGNYILVPGAPYRNSFCFDSVYHSGQFTTKAGAKELGSPITILEVPSSISNIKLPTNCKIPVKISNSVISPIVSHIITNTSRNYNYVCKGSGTLNFVFCPYAEMRLAFLSDGYNTYLGYAPTSTYASSIELKLKAASNASSQEFPDILLNVINYVDNIDIPITNDIEYCVGQVGGDYQYYVDIYPSTISNLYNQSTNNQTRFVVTASMQNQVSLPQEYRYLRYMDYHITCNSKLYNPSLAPTQQQLPNNTMLTGARFHC